MIDFGDHYNSSLDRYVGGVAKTGLAETYKAFREADRAGERTWSEGVLTAELTMEQTKRIQALGSEPPTIPNPTITPDDAWVAASNPNIDAGSFQRDLEAWKNSPDFKRQVEAYNARIAELRVLHPTEDLKTWEELRAQAPIVAKEKHDIAMEKASRASLSTQIIAGFGSGAVGSFQEPLTIAGMAATIPFGLGSFAGGTAVQALKLGIMEGVVGGTTEAINQAQVIDYYRRQGFTDEEIQTRVAMNVGGAALGGAIVAPVVAVGAKGLGKALSRLHTAEDAPTRLQAIADLQAAADAFSPSQRAILDNVEDVTRVEAFNPFTATPETIRNHFRTMDALADALDRGKVDILAADLPNHPLRPELAKGDLLSTTSLSRRVRPEGEGVDINPSSLKAVGVPDRPAASPEFVNASLQNRMAQAMVREAEKRVADAEAEIAAVRVKVDEAGQAKADLQAQIAKEVPDTEALARAGMDPDTINLLRDTEEALAGGKLSKKDRARLEKDRAAILESVKPEIEQAKARMAQQISELEAAASKAVGDEANLMKRLAQATKELDTTSRQASNIQKKLDRLTAKETAPKTREDIIDEVLARRGIEAPRHAVTRSDKAAQEVAVAKEVASGKYDKNMVREAMDYLDQVGDVVFTDPATGETRSIRQTITEIDEDVEALEEILKCLAGAA